MTRQPLNKALRRTLEATVVKARDIAEQAAIQAVKRLGVGDAKPADYLSDEQRKLRTRLPDSIPVIGVGGILQGADAAGKLAAGAALVQCYSGLVYRGPSLIGECVDAMRRRREQGTTRQ